MSLDTYANLKLEIEEWTHRGNTIVPQIDTFIDLAESEMFANTIEPLQVRSEETLEAIATSITDRFVALPTGYQSMRKLRIQIVNGKSVELKFKTPNQLQVLDSTGMPLFFTVTDQIEMERISDQVYAGEIQFYKDFTALSDENTTNSILTNSPTIYLFGALWAFKNWAEEPQDAAAYYQQFISAITGANNKDKLGRYGPAPVMQAEGSTP